MKSILTILFSLILFMSPLSSQNILEFEPRLNDYNFENLIAIDDSVALDSFIVAKMEQYHFPGLAACIVKDDKIIWKNNYGYADIDSNKLVTDSTLFIIQSTSKTITATALMQLWERGLFGLDEDINNYLPFQVRNPIHANDPITFRMLLTHTSSIHDNWDVLDSTISWGEDSPIALDSFLVNYLVKGGTYYYSNNFNSFAPGTQRDYCDVGVGLLGYLVERISNSSFERYCQDSIFVPLGMNETSWFLANLNINNIAIPYNYSAGKYSPYEHCGWPTYPDGQIRTSAIQLSRFISAFIRRGLMNGVRILESSTVDSITTVQYPSIDPSQGLIWYLGQHNIPDVGTRMVCYHSGGWYGANSIAGYIIGTGENIGSIVFTNSKNNNGIYEIGIQLLSYGLITDLEREASNFAKIFTLNQNYPNPFNPSTTIEYQIPKTCQVDLNIYNTLGQKVATLVSQKQTTGNYEIEWNASNFASGIYYYRLETDQGFVETKKLIVLK